MSVRRETMDYQVRSMFQGPHSDGPRHDGTVVRPKVSGGSGFSVFGSMPLQGVHLSSDQRSSECLGPCKD